MGRLQSHITSYVVVLSDKGCSSKEIFWSHQEWDARNSCSSHLGVDWTCLITLGQLLYIRMHLFFMQKCILQNPERWACSTPSALGPVMLPAPEAFSPLWVRFIHAPFPAPHKGWSPSLSHRCPSVPARRQLWDASNFLVYETFVLRSQKQRLSA